MGHKSHPGRWAQIFDLSAYRRRKFLGGCYSVLYLNSEGEHLQFLRSFPFLKVLDVRNPIDLRTQLLISEPAMIVVESRLDWAEPSELIAELNSLRVPQILFAHAQSLLERPELLKEAFACGLQDSLKAPVASDDFLEVMDVLLKLRTTAY